VKPRIKIAGDNIRLFELNLPESNSSPHTWKEIYIPLISNVSAGVVAAAILFWLTVGTQIELKSLELQNTRQTVLWKTRVLATKNNLDALSELHSYIKYDLEREVYKVIEDVKFYDFLLNRTLTPSMFSGYLQKHREAMNIVKANAPFLSEEMAESSDGFLVSMESLVHMNMFIMLDEKLLVPLRIRMVPEQKIEHSDETYKFVKGVVKNIENNFIQYYDELQIEYRRSLNVN